MTIQQTTNNIEFGNLRLLFPIQTPSKIETICDCSPKHKQYNSWKKRFAVSQTIGKISIDQKETIQQTTNNIKC